ncbi:MAG: hypothetical protein M3021_12295 [Actinomycetota bacterium]|nr:hypothetical protein [Actinomycetota bacterium]
MFLARPQEMFAEDRFHPSNLGYRRSAKALLPALLEALDRPGLAGDRVGADRGVDSPEGAGGGPD